VVSSKAGVALTGEASAAVIAARSVSTARIRTALVDHSIAGIAGVTRFTSADVAAGNRGASAVVTDSRFTVVNCCITVCSGPLGVTCALVAARHFTTVAVNTGTWLARVHFLFTVIARVTG
jgi:hypothetical protein